MEGDVKPIMVEVDGIKFTSASRYYEGNTREITHRLKDNDKEAIDHVASILGRLLPPFNVLVPVPNRCGYARETLQLAKAISKVSHTPVADVLKGNERESLYSMKKQGKLLTEKQLGFRQVKPLPFYRTPIIIDNVAATGLSAKAAYHALGNRGEVLTFAIDDPLLDRAKQIERTSSSIKR